MVQRRFSLLMLMTAVLLLLWGAGWLGWISLLNGLLYDQIGRLPAPSPPPPKVVLVEGANPATVGEWRRLFSELSDNGAPLIALSRLPAALSAEEAAGLAADFPLLFGLDPARAATPTEGLPWALSTRPPAEYGVYRDQWRRAPLGEGDAPALEWAAARALGVAEAEGLYRVDFSRGETGLPVVGIERVLAGGLVRELMEGRVALIAPAEDDAATLFSPLGGGAISLGRYQAYALDTLLNRNGPRLLSNPWLGGLIGSIAGLVLVLVLTRLPGDYAVPFYFTSLLLTLGGAWAALAFARWWPPVAELLVAAAAAGWLFRRLVAGRKEQAVRAVALEGAARLENRWTPEEFNASDEHWSQVASLITQTLALRRVILLERVEGDHRVREVKALNCGLEDIGEMRRDYERTPYTTAIERGGPLLLDRDYLKPLDDGEEEQYLVPLLFAGDVLGFWAFGSRPVDETERPRFMAVVGEFAGQIAELLHQRRRWLARRRMEQRPLARLLRLEVEDPAYQSVHRSMTLLNRRLTVMESVLDGMDTAAILYDLFGRVIHVNRPMEGRLREAGLAPFDMTAADLIARLGGRSLDEARNYMSYLIVKQGSISLPARLDRDGEADDGLMLKVRPIRQRERAAEDQAAPFEMLGVLCELVDVSQLRGLYRLKEQLVDRVSARFRNDLEAVVVACSLIRDQRLSVEQRDEVFSLIDQKVSDAVAANAEIHGMLAVDLGEEGVERYPVDVAATLERALEEVEALFVRQRITLDASIPRLVGLAFAAPGQLHGVFRAALKLLLGDAVEGSALRVEAVNYGRIVMIKMENQGFGIPDERLREYLTGDQELTSEAFGDLRHALHLVSEWGGELVARSAVGEGMEVTIALEAFDS